MYGNVVFVYLGYIVAEGGCHFDPAMLKLLTLQPALLYFRVYAIWGRYRRLICASGLIVMMMVG